MILVIFIKAVAELGVIPYAHLFIVNFLLAIKPKIFKIHIQCHFETVYKGR